MNYVLCTQDALLASCFFLGVCKILDTVEHMRLHAEFSDGGIYGWDVHRHRAPFQNSKLMRNLMAKLYRGKIIWFTWVMQLLSGLILVIGWRLPFECVVVALWVVAATGLMGSMRCTIGQEGADQMANIIAITLAVCTSFSGEGRLLHIGFLFISAQLALAYFAAGVAKLYGSTWQNGTAVGDILSSKGFGTPILGRWLLSAPGVCRTLTWSVIAFECGFPLVFLAKPDVVLAVLLVAVCFHVCNAVLMGLNSFIWAFAAAYPPLVCALHWLHGP